MQDELQSWYYVYDYDATGTVLRGAPIASVYSMPATLADVRVEIMPEIRAEMATLDTSPARSGAS